MSFTPLLACDGCFVGAPAVISLIIAILVLIGSIYLLLASNYGAREAYLVLMVALSAWMIIMSAIWLFGAPGTTTSTGPRGREPAWVPFLPTSEQAGDFQREIARFPNEWDVSGEIYPGGIDSRGELITVSTDIRNALSRLAKKQGLEATKPSDWAFFPADQTPATEAEAAAPKATVRYYMKDGSPLMFGVTIPATDKHREITVFAFRDKGLVFLHGAVSLLVSVLLFVLHLALLARLERRQKAREAQLSGEPVLA